MSSPHLHRKLQDALGEDAGEELAAMTDRIDPIRGDVGELRHTVRGDIAELRHAMEQGFARVDAHIEKSAKEQMRFFLLALGVQMAAIVGLYGTLVALVR